MQTLNIATACFVNEAEELLVVRKRNSSIWMLPGGKIEAGETPAEALVRELREELQIEVSAAALQSLGAFQAVAANEANSAVQAQVFLVQMPKAQTPAHAAEIAEIQWLPLGPALPANITPLLRDCIIPALALRLPGRCAGIATP